MAFVPKTVVNAGVRKLVLPTEQAGTKAMSHSVLKIFPSQSAPTNAWGSGGVDVKIAPGDVQLIDSAYLQLQLPALTVTGGTYSRFVNDACFFLDRYEVYSSGSDAPILVKSASAGLITYLEDLLFVSPADKTSLWAATHNGTDATRSTNSAAAQTILIPLYLPMTQSSEGFLNAAASGFTIRFFLNALSTVVQTDGTAPVCPITSLSLLINGRTIDSQPAFDAAMAVPRSMPTHMRFLSPVTQSGIQLPSGTTSITVPLTSAVGQCAFAVVTVRLNSLVNTALGNAPDTFVPVSTIDLKRASGEQILSNQLSGSYLSAVLPHTLALSGDIGDLRTAGPKAAYMLPFCERPEIAWKYGRYSGHADFGGSETLTLTFPSALGALNVCDIVFYMWTLYEQGMNGTIHRI